LAYLSLIIPGLGQVLSGHLRQAQCAFLKALGVFILAVMATQAFGPYVLFIGFAAIPWWMQQSRDAYLWGHEKPVIKPSLSTLLQIGRERGDDIRILGAILLAVSLITPWDMTSEFALLSQNVLMLPIGYGLLNLRKWAYWAYVPMAFLQVLLIASVTDLQAQIGAAIASLLILLAYGYISIRRSCFKASVTQEIPVMWG
jgi:hypothetical protein